MGEQRQGEGCAVDFESGFRGAGCEGDAGGWRSGEGGEGAGSGVEARRGEYVSRGGKVEEGVAGLGDGYVAAFFVFGPPFLMES